MKKYLPLMLFSLFLVGVVGYGVQNYFKEKNTIVDLKVGVTSGKSGDWLFDMAQEKGFFDRENLNIKKIEAPDNTIALLTSGEADVTTQQISSALIPYLNNEDVKMVAVLENKQNNYGLSKYPENELAKIKKVGVPKLGGAFHINVIPMLENLGVDTGSVEFVAIGSAVPARIALLNKGAIDFTIINGSDIPADLKNWITLIGPDKLYTDNYTPTSVVATGKTIQDKSVPIQRYVNALAKTTKYAVNNKDETVRFLMDKVKMSEAVATGYYEKEILPGRDLDLIPEPSKLTRLMEAVVNVANPQNPNRSLTDFVYTKFAKEAYPFIK